MSVSISSTPATTLKPVPTLPPNENKANQKKFHGFVAGVTSGVTKLVVGHPFGK